MRTSSSACLLAILAAGCTMQAPATYEPPSAAISSPFVPRLTPTQPPPTALPTVTSTAAPLPTPFVPFTVTTSVDNVLLRTDPGYLFPQLGMLREGSSLLALAKSPGGEWLLCETEDHRAGWVFAQLLQLGGGNLDSVPVVWPPSVQVLQGRVRDSAGQPVSGVQYSIVQGAGERPPRNDAVTDSSGMFYAFMPIDAAGQWLVSYTAIACTSNTMDAKCNCVGGVCGHSDPESLSVDLAASQDQVLQFTWK